MKKKLSISSILLLFGLYTTQYLGLAFFTEALIAILRKNNVSLEFLGLIYMLGLFWVLRFLWAPIIDKIEFKKLGHFKSWIIIFQSLMVLTLFLISFFNLTTSLETIIILSIFFAFFSASQDVSLDALAFKTVFKKQRPLVNALKIAGGLIGMVLGSGMGLIIYKNYGWNITILSLAFLTLVPLIQIFFFKEAQNSYKHSTLINYKQYLVFCEGKNKKKWIILLFIYPITISSAFGLISPLLVDIGWELDKIGFAVHIVGYGLGIVAALFSSSLINKFSRKRILIFAAFGQSFSMSLLLFLLQGYDNIYFAIFIVGTIFIFYTPSQVVITTLIMDKCSNLTPATQFALQHSVYMFSGILFSSLSVTASGFFGYEAIILLGTFFGLFAAYYSSKLDIIIGKNKN